MLDQLIDLDKHVFVFLNGLRCEWADSFMWWFSQSATWLPVAIILCIVIIKTKGKESLGIILALGLTILIADQVSSGLIKPIVERLRPSHEPTLAGMVHTVNGYMGGKYGFVSSHAANSFGIAMFTILLFKNRLYTAVMLIWAILDCYSRIYLGVHYPGDLIGGTIVGICAALISFVLLSKFRPQSLRLSKKSTTTAPNSGFTEQQILMVSASMILSIVILAIISAI